MVSLSTFPPAPVLPTPSPEKIIISLVCVLLQYLLCLTYINIYKNIQPSFVWGINLYGSTCSFHIKLALSPLNSVSQRSFRIPKYRSTSFFLIANLYSMV